MALTVTFDAPQGLALTLEIYPLAAGAILNGAGGDACVERTATGDLGCYDATVAETLAAGTYRARVVSSAVTLMRGYVKLATGDTTASVVGDYPAAATAEVSAEDIEDIADAIAAQGVVLATYTITVGDDDIDPPASAGLTTGYLLCLGTDGAAEAGVTITAEMVTGPGTAGFALDRGTITMTSGVDGIAQHTGFVQGAAYRFKRGTDRWWSGPQVAPATSSWAIGEIIGKA